MRKPRPGVTTPLLSNGSYLLDPPKQGDGISDGERGSHRELAPFSHPLHFAPNFPHDGHDEDDDNEDDDDDDDSQTDL
jgi:hypothetical protein